MRSIAFGPVSVPFGTGAFACDDFCPSMGVLPLPGTFRRTRSEPTATTSPIVAPSQTISPATRDGISTVDLSVMTAASAASSRTISPILTCHSTSSASATPSPTSGSLITCSDNSRPHHIEQRAAHSGRTGEVVPLLCMWIRCIPARHPGNGRLEMIEAGLLHKRRKLRAESRCQRRLMHDHAPARFADRHLNRLQVERQQCTKFDDFSIDAGFSNRRHSDIHHSSVRENCQRRTVAPNSSLAQGYSIVALGNLTELVACPRRHGAIIMTVERSIVEPLWLQEDHRIRILDCRYQQPLGIAWIRWHDRFDTAHMGEQSFWALAR